MARVIFALVAVSLVMTMVSGNYMAYVVAPLTFECVPLAGNVCPGDILFPKEAAKDTKFLEELAKHLKNLVDQKIISQACRDSLFEVLCTGLPGCAPKKIIPSDITAMVASCEKANTKCPAALGSVFNCTTFKQTFVQVNAVLQQAKLPE